MQERDPSWQSSYSLLPSGVCHRIVSSTESLNVAQWANVTGGFADKWTHPSDSFDSKSWERVANDEMWHSKYDLLIVISCSELSNLWCSPSVIHQMISQIFTSSVKPRNFLS